MGVDLVLPIYSQATTSHTLTHVHALTSDSEHPPPDIFY